MKQKTLDKAARALLGLKGEEHKRPPKPTRKDLDRKFVMRTDRKSKTSVDEVRGE